MFNFSNNTNGFVFLDFTFDRTNYQFYIISAEQRILGEEKLIRKRQTLCNINFQLWNDLKSVEIFFNVWFKLNLKRNLTFPNHPLNIDDRINTTPWLTVKWQNVQTSYSILVFVSLENISFLLRRHRCTPVHVECSWSAIGISEILKRKAS